MEPSPERFSRTIWIGVGLLIVILCLSFVLSRLKPDSPKSSLPVLNQIADFTLTNQNGHRVTLADLHGQVWVADIIFTLCPGPCPRMTRQMAEIQAALAPGGDTKFVTITTDPVHDTPDVLKRYPERLGLKTSDRWVFLTGEKKEIAKLAIDSLKLSTVEKKPEDRTSYDDLFIHSTMFVLVDKQGRLRGFKDEQGAVRAGFETGGEGVEWTNVLPKIVATVKQLERE
jgi:cytochrome oxidase Cu insertion factor (SCO1/SenC/PrrC family)